MRAWICCAALLLAAAPVAQAHPVPRESHDRTIVVRLGRDVGQIVVVVDYRLEVDEWTVIYQDMEPFRDEVPLARYQGKRDAFYAEFTRLYAPVLAANLSAAVDGKALDFKATARGHRLTDEKGQALGHLRCDFRFEACWQAPPPSALTLALRCWPLAGQPGSVALAALLPAHRFTFRENNYELKEGQVDVSLAATAAPLLLAKQEAPDAVKKRPVVARLPGDDDRLRQVAAIFVTPPSLPETPRPAVTPVTPPPVPPAPETTVQPHAHETTLLDLFLDSDHGFWVLLLLAFGLGAAHALTPGHGKTLVAAYLVGERGTIWHAVLLGVVTTLTHTSSVLVLAAVLWLWKPDRAAVQTGLGVGMGLVVACLGFWLLLRRLAGRADHVHLPGHGHHHHHGGHHHHHGPADHTHDEHG